jgi:hypothetical protein
VMTIPVLLPEKFRELEKYVKHWALRSEEERFHKLVNTSLPELREFFEAVMPRMDDAIDYLSPFSPEAMPSEAARLHDLLVTFVETAHPVELNWSTTFNKAALSPARLCFHGPSALEK